MGDKIRVTVWNEGRHEKTNDEVKKIYPNGMHAVIAKALSAADDLEVRTATLDDGPEHGLTEQVLAATDVLTWWGHTAHGEVSDEVVARVQKRVLSGMGLIVLHSGHFSKIFTALMGTTCTLKWREIGEKERLWNLEPSHPITEGIGDYIELPKLDGEPVCTECGQRWGPDPKQVRSGSVQCAYGIDSGSEITSGAVESPQVFRSLSVQRVISKQEVAEAIETMDFEVSSNVDVRHPCKLQPYEEHECYPVNEAGERLDVPELGPAREWTLQKPVEVRAGDTTTLHVTLRHAMRITVTAVGPPC